MVVCLPLKVRLALGGSLDGRDPLVRGVSRALAQMASLLLSIVGRWSIAGVIGVLIHPLTPRVAVPTVEMPSGQAGFEAGAHGIG